MTYKLAVFIGRFSPLHKGHEEIINTALMNAEKVLVLVGSSNRPRSERNPFTYQERREMVNLAIPDRRVIVQPLQDILYNDDLWMEQVQSIVRSFEVDDSEVALIGHEKDASSYYINMFPQWDSIGVAPFPNYHLMGDVTLDATFLRNKLYSDNNPNTYQTDFEYAAHGTVSPAVSRYVKTLDISAAKAEHDHNKKYKKLFEDLKYPPIHHTVDAVVIQSGHILMVQRGAMPGEGLMALPGGFLNEDEKLLDGAMRELREETKLKVPEPVLRGHITREETFDEPKRSGRGRTITTAFAINLENGPLPKVKGSDDAKKAYWVPLSDLNPAEMFEDHYDIIQVMIGQRAKTN